MRLSKFINNPTWLCLWFDFFYRWRPRHSMHFCLDSMVYFVLGFYVNLKSSRFPRNWTYENKWDWLKSIVCINSISLSLVCSYSYSFGVVTHIIDNMSQFHSNNPCMYECLIYELRHVCSSFHLSKCVPCVFFLLLLLRSFPAFFWFFYASFTRCACVFV